MVESESLRAVADLGPQVVQDSLDFSGFHATSDGFVEVRRAKKKPENTEYALTMKHQCVS